MEILLRDTTEADLPLIMSWRSHPLIYQGFFTQRTPLNWEEHLNWWRSRNNNRRDFIIVAIEDTHFRDIGAVNVTQLFSDIPEIGYYIGEISLWGKGIGKQAVKLICQWLKDRDYKRVQAEVAPDNPRSISLLRSLGFKPAIATELGRERWVRELDEKYQGGKVDE